MVGLAPPSLLGPGSRHCYGINYAHRADYAHRAAITLIVPHAGVLSEMAWFQQLQYDVR